MTSAEHERTEHRKVTSGPSTPLIVAATTVVLLIPRLVAVWRGGWRVTEVLNFDEGAYFSAAALLADGHTLYRDAAAAHPPGFFLLAAPFTLLGPPSLSINVVRSLNALVGVAAIVLVAHTVARASGDRRAYLGAVVVGLLPDVVRADRMVLVDPLLNLVCAATFALWWRATSERPAEGAVATGERSPRRWDPALLAGAVFGLALMVKWWAVLILPAVVVSSTPPHRRAQLGRFAAAAGVVAAAAIALTLLVSGRAAFDQTVLFQLARQENGAPLVERARSVLGVPVSFIGTRVLLVPLLLLLALAVARSLEPTMRRLLGFGAVWALCIIAAFAVVGSYDSQYNGHLGPALTIVASVVLVTLCRQLGEQPVRRRRLAALAMAVVAILVVHDLRWVRGDTLAPALDIRPLADVVDSDRGCVFAFEPNWLIPLDLLPDVDRLGPVASETYVSSWLTAIRAGDRTNGPYGSAAVAETWQQVTSCPTVMVGSRGRGQLADRWDEFQELYEQVGTTTPDGPDVWVRRSGS